jgi:hypothetical protein
MSRLDNVAYVASTLPVSVLDQRLHEWQIARILVASSHLESSYRYLQKKHPQIEILVVPRQPFLQLLTLFGHLLCSRIHSRKVYFFHECCCFLFDVLIGLIKPTGVFHPIVTLDSFERLEFWEVPRESKKKIISLFGLSKQFTPYLRDGDNGTVGEIVWARSEYPHCITKFTKLPLIKTGAFIDIVLIRNKPNILILLGSDVISSSVLRAFYERFLNSFSEDDVCFYGKDHPNPGSRLTFAHERLKTIDPYCPIELIKDDFDFIIGVASTALLNYPGRAISILGLLENEDSQAVERRLKPFIGMLRRGELLVPHTLEELVNHVKISNKTLKKIESSTHSLKSV